MDRAALIEQAAWATAPNTWNGEVELGGKGAPLSLIFMVTERIGAGPRLHRHTYAETFIIREGRALFTVGDDEIEARAGQIVVVPAMTPHRFRTLGPGTFDTINIHAAGAFSTEWLE